MGVRRQELEGRRRPCRGAQARRGERAGPRAEASKCGAAEKGLRKEGKGGGKGEKLEERGGLRAEWRNRGGRVGASSTSTSTNEEGLGAGAGGGATGLGAAATAVTTSGLALALSKRPSIAAVLRFGDERLATVLRVRNGRLAARLGEGAERLAGGLRFGSGWLAGGLVRGARG